jgi:hypothetical protein
MTMTTNPTRPATSSMEAANAGRQRKAGERNVADVLRRLRYLDDATLARLVDAALFEQLIRAQAATMDDDGDGER